MNRKEHLLTILAEECVETAQRATKALRFGINEIQEGQNQDNAERIVYEFNDLFAVMNMLVEEGYIKNDEKLLNAEALERKKQRVEKYLLVSKKQGTLIS